MDMRQVDEQRSKARSLTLPMRKGIQNRRIKPRKMMRKACRLASWNYKERPLFKSLHALGPSSHPFGMRRYPLPHHQTV